MRIHNAALWLGLCGAVATAGAVNIDPAGRARIRAARVGVSAQGRTQAHDLRRAQGEDPAVTVRGFLKLAPGYSASDFDKYDWLTVTGGRGSMLTVEFDSRRLADFEALEGVAKFSAERNVTPKMDRVRAVSGIDAVHAGTDLQSPYSGHGVVCGSVDGGFDPNHVNFKNEDGSSRIRRFIYFRPTEEGDLVKEIHNAEYIPNIDTERSDTYHGTHTLGIMAGSYRGKVRHAVTDATGTVTTPLADNPYYGVAYGSDLAVVSGAASDYYIAQGIESLLDYAYSKDKPMVVNLSLGSSIGPHDGTSAMCEYLDEMSELDRVVFCIAAGNEGELPISLRKTFTDDDMVLKSIFSGSNDVDGYTNFRFGQTTVYSDTSAPFELQMLLLNKKTGQILLRLPLAPTEGGEKYLCTGPEWGVAGDILSPVLAEYFNGYMGVAGNYEEPSGRYMTLIDLALFDKTDGRNWNGDYVIAFQVTGTKAGQRVDVYGDAQLNYFTSYGVEGYEDGITDGTISDIACGKNTIAVGSYNTRSQWGSLDKETYGYLVDFPEGEVSAFSSYGSLIDGRTLPHVCAPGTGVISSVSEYYLKDAGLSDESVQAYASNSGRQHHWMQGVGTSMATPVVSGTVALWLEANPSLTYKDVQEILAMTSVKDADVEQSGKPGQWGAGKLDAYAGIKEALRRPNEYQGVDGIATPKALLKAMGAGLYELCIPGLETLTAEVYAADGRSVAAISADSDTATVDLAAMPKGVYVIKAGSAALRVIR